METKSNKKWNIYVVHHSHTDIGYTDLQEKIIYNHVDYIKTATKVIQSGYEEDTIDQKFKWNCETYFCVEKFLEEATEEEKSAFFDAVRKGNIGVSANYLNFNDLVDKSILNKRIKEMVDLFAKEDIRVNSAMNADVNGIHLGNLDAFVENGIDFFYTNIHCHHGMYPIYQNQKPYYWENAAGKKLLVWNGEHYHLGNVFEIIENQNVNFMTENYSNGQKARKQVDKLKEHLTRYIKECVDYGYEYDFIPLSVSGVFSDNAPPNTNAIKVIEEFNATYGEDIEIQMVTLSQLYDLIKDKVVDAPAYRGDLTDWWAHGAASTPYAVKHYKEAQRAYHLCNRLDPDERLIRLDYEREAEDNLLLFAEHTWGHSATITNPYDTMVQNLDIRNISYASKAHEATAKNLNRIMHSKGDKLRYYNRKGRVKAINTSKQTCKVPVEFYIEVYGFGGIKVIDEVTKEEKITQIAPHPRGILINFIDTFAPLEEKIYTYEEIPALPEVFNTRVAYTGSERVRDIVNTYDPITYTLPYGLENDYFKITYEIGRGITSFYNKLLDCEMLLEGDGKFFTPIYENTEIRTDVYEERRLLGRNIRGLHAKKHIGQLTKIKTLAKGAIYSSVELEFSLSGTYFSSIVIKMYHDLPKIEFKYKCAKTLSDEIESLYLPLALNLPDTTRYVDKGDVAFRPGVDQIPGTCMEYYLVDNGILYKGDKANIIINTLDAPMVYMGELKHHPIVLCDNKMENNQRNMYSWIMNNCWETNFKLDLSGITEYCYCLNMTSPVSVEESFDQLKNEGLGIVTFII